MSEGDSNVGDYSLISCVATGNTTQIWESKHTGTGQVVALKLLLEEALADAEAKKVLKAEAALGKKFEHPNLVKVYDLAVNKNYGYFAMEYLRAPNVKSLARNDRPALHGITKNLLLAVASGLEHMHEKGFLHRDIKPDNILATKSGDVRLIDYSLAGPPDSAVSSLLKGQRSRKIMGTRTYIAPEMIKKKPISFATDIYSLGVTVFEVLTGHPPFMGSDPNQLLIKHVRDRAPDPKDEVPNLTDEANAFVLKMLAKDPKARPQTMQEFTQELRGIDFWLEPPAEYYQAKKERELSGEDDVVKHLDSRADAAVENRKISTDQPPPKPKPRLIDDPPKKEAPKQPAAQAPAPQQPPAQQPYAPPPGYGMPQQPYPQMPPGYPPPGQYPQQPYPGQQFPGQGYPQQPYPGQPQPGQPHPGQPQPGQMPPGYPQPQMPPGYGAPDQPPPQPAAPMPPPAQPNAPQPAAPQPVAPQPVVPKADDSDKPDDDGMDLMMDLPPVS